MVNSCLASCHKDMDIFLDTCKKTGVPIAHDKTVGPSQVVTYLGIEIDARKQVIRVPGEKLKELVELLHSWTSRRECTKRELCSLVGSLSTAAKVVKPGRLFYRFLIDLSTTVKSYDHHIYLNASARADIDWWRRFVRTWNGVEFFTRVFTNSQKLQLSSDASFRGMGATFGRAWFSVPFPDSFRALQNINVLELFAVVSAFFTWGRQWRDMSVQFFTDNQCVLDVWRKTTARNTHILILLRALFFFCAERNIHLSFTHIPGKENLPSDALSRLQVDRFKQLCPFAEEHPTEVDPTVWALF